MNAAQAAAILAGAVLDGGPALGQTCTSCHVEMKRLEGKLGYLFCSCCGCSPEVGHLLGHRCDCPPHPVEGVICQ